jgi:hypothetical protein
MMDQRRVPMSTPGSVEFEQYILRTVLDQFLEIGLGDNLDTICGLFRLGCSLRIYRDLTDVDPLESEFIYNL